MGCGSGAVVMAMIRPVMSRSSRRSRRFHGRVAIDLGIHTRAGERHGVAKLQVSRLY